MTASQPVDARQKVDQVIRDAIAQRASDIHLEPAADHFEVRLRIDGILKPITNVEMDTGRAMVTRLMVMAQLLTYRLDIPQEGRILFHDDGNAVELRLAVIPTRHGMRAAVRMPAELIQPRDLTSLGMPANVLDRLKQFAASDTGMLLLTGPAGSGKTTTIYALLQYIVATSPGLSIVTIEDPIERDLAGITQIEVSPHRELTYERALMSILRQDPQVLMLGEIRDAATASLAVQAALSGHRLIATLHAGSAGGAIARLLEMGLEPYQISSALYGIVAQRLVRKRLEDGTYAGRIPLAEIALMDEPLRQALLRRADANELQKVVSQQPQYVPMRTEAQKLVTSESTDIDEIERVLGKM